MELLDLNNCEVSRMSEEFEIRGGEFFLERDFDIIPCSIVLVSGRSLYFHF